MHLYHDFFPTRGGIEDYLAGLTRLQGEEPGLEPVVLCANSAPVTRLERWGGVQIVRAASLGRYFTPLCPSWPLWLRRLQPDIVHLHLPCPLGEWTLGLATPAGARIVVSLHNDYVRPKAALKLHGPIHQAILQKATAIVAATPDYARTSKPLAALQAKVRIVPYGIDLAPYTAGPTGSSEDSRERGGILSAGRLCYYKGIEVLLEAAPAIRAPITIIGDGPWRQRLEAQAQRRRLGKRVHFAGAVSEDRLIQAMGSSALFVFPSTERSEAFGLAQLKAMASGLPVVSSDLPGVSWLNRHEETGLTVPPRDPVALAQAINRLLADISLRERLAQGARTRAAQFDLASMSRATAGIYESLN